MFQFTLDTEYPGLETYGLDITVYYPINPRVFLNTFYPHWDCMTIVKLDTFEEFTVFNSKEK